MDALALLAVTLLVSVILWAYFAFVDANAAFDGSPETHTASERIKRWRRRSELHTLALAGVVAALAVIPVYLFAHLIFELV